MDLEPRQPSPRSDHGATPLTIAIDPDEGPTILRIRGRLDRGAALALSGTLALVEARSPVTFDLAGVTSIDDAGCDALRACAAQVRDRVGAPAIACTDPVIRLRLRSIRIEEVATVVFHPELATARPPPIAIVA
jgi:anti-anti-sigma regulatory factor